VKHYEKIVTAGNKGTGVRSDCFVTLEMLDSGGLQVELKSKVDVMYGAHIRELCLQSLQFFGIKNAKMKVEDSGALDFVIMARIEAAVRQLIETEDELLPEMLEENTYATTKERFRFSRLYLPGNSPSLMLNAGVHKPNAVILDLEDSVAAAKKSEAQLLVRNALRAIDFYGAERMVRINQFPYGLDDLEYIVEHNVHVILVPKCEDADQIIEIEKSIFAITKDPFPEKPIYFMPIIESALGVENAYEIATSSEHIIALAIGLEDFTADLGVRRTKAGTESLYARMRVVNACKAAGIQPIDSVFSDVGDMDGLRENVKVSKSLGFEGMGCIHPRQIKVIHDSFAPEADEIEKAKKIVLAFFEAEEKGLGVVSLGTKMIDAPVVKRAQKTITLAENLGIIPKNWREQL